VSEEDVQAAFQAMVNDLGGEEAVEEMLASQGMTVEQYLDQQRVLLLAQALRAKVVGEVGERAEQIHARHIMVKTEAEAQRALARVRAGENFAKVAREMSEDAASADKGGDLGWFPRDIMPPEFDVVAFSLEPGEISAIVEIPPGYHVIQVLERDPDRRLSEEHWQMLMENGTQRFYDWLHKERAKADVKILIGR
jgi:parvulin-like peptidyl-prolyl isomerase